MWKRRLGSTVLLLLFCSQALVAQSSDSKWQALDDLALLQEAASAIERLKLLNEDLKKEASEALKELKELSRSLKALKAELAESERMRMELVESLRRSEELWKNCEKEARNNNLRMMMVGIGIGTLVGIVATMGMGRLWNVQSGPR